MAQSSLVKIKYKIKADKLDIIKQNNDLLDSLKGIYRIYSYVVFTDYNDNTLDGWTITINIHENDRYNTILVGDAVHNIVNDISAFVKQTTNRQAIGFGQPSINVMLELYEPYMRSIALKMHNRWKMYEYEDLISICRLCMCVLYNAGYYLNKALLQKAFSNYVLLELRKIKNAPQIVSMDSINQNGICLKDILADTIIDERQYDEEANNISQSIFEEERQEVITVIGQRAYNELLRQYRSKVVDANTTSQIRRLKEKLNRKGITYNKIKNKILGE